MGCTGQWNSCRCFSSSTAVYVSLYTVCWPLWLGGEGKEREGEARGGEKGVNSQSKESQKFNGCAHL